MAPAHSPIVLVHGAWQTAATWDLAAPLLRAAGHLVVCPELTGLEGRGDLDETIKLDTHIDDVVRALASDNLERVVLVGHSYAGMIITGVAEQAADRVAALVYADAFIPLDGLAVMDLLPEVFRTAFRNQAKNEGGGWRLPASERQLDLWGLQPGPVREFVKARQSDFTVNCFEQPIALPANAAAALPRGYVACTAEQYPAKVAFAPFAQRARAEGWQYHELPTGHDCHAEMPEAFASIVTAMVADVVK